MRGKVPEIPFSKIDERITPAYAGKSPKFRKVKIGFQDHPRLCGEKDYNLLEAELAERITPAYAGKRYTPKQKKRCCQDHPRLCGEKFLIPSTIALKMGSPPPMRGKATLYIDQLATFRITPAYAGKSSRYGLFCAENKDHPRLCGEKRHFALLWLPVVGSPPPMRGKAPFRFVVVACGGITPAYAGKSFSSFVVYIITQDHPRLCGEKYKKLQPKRYAVWITPAYAGKRNEKSARTNLK